MGLERPLSIIEAKATGLGRKDQERVVRTNAARMLRLE
jgi:predicted TIM-barrel fold metal-dependent hydrolase